MTSTTLEAVYENGVLRSLGGVQLAEHRRVTVTITAPSPQSPPAESCYDLAVRAGIVGALRDGPADLSTNPKHFEGFGTLNVRQP